VRDELVEMNVAPESKFVVVSLGFDLSPFRIGARERAEMRASVRAEFGIPPDASLMTLVARLVPIKRVDRFLRLANALRDIPGMHFLIVGDGELREPMQASAEALGLGKRLVWSGFRQDMPAMYAASDLVVQTSDNEGTPVALIEAQAAGVPVLSTRVGGVASAIGDDALFAAAHDESGLADKARRLLTDVPFASRAGRSGQMRVLTHFGLKRLIADIDALYRSLRNWNPQR
jgi:glycosyltransferase involved in cell wall biosynthesis